MHTEGLASLDTPQATPKQKEVKICKWCGKPFIYIPPHRNKKKGRKYCEEAVCLSQRRRARREKNGGQRQYTKEEEVLPRFGKRQSLLTKADEKALAENCT